MTLSKLDLALVAVLAAALFGVEQQHRVVIEPAPEAAVSDVPASVCPATDDVPFSAACLKFISVGRSIPGLPTSDKGQRG